MSNFKMILPEVDVNEIHKSEIDETIMLLIEFKNDDSIKEFLRKYKENKPIDLYLTGYQFKDDYVSRKKMVSIKNIEIIAFSLIENTILIKLNDYEYVDISELRKNKIKNILNN